MVIASNDTCATFAYVCDGRIVVCDVLSSTGSQTQNLSILLLGSKLFVF